MGRKVFGVSIKGLSHVNNRTPNQDSFLCYKNRQFSLIVVSDGLGSKPYSSLGSKAACKAVLKAAKCFVKNKTTTSIKDFYENISINWKARLHRHNINECSATCLFALATKNKVFFSMLGDGMICFLGKLPEKSLILSDSKNETFFNETYSLSNSNSIYLWKFESYPIEDCESVLIATDGISADLSSGSEIEFSNELIKSLKHKFIFLRKLILKKMLRNWPAISHSDDKTIAIMELV